MSAHLTDLATYEDRYDRTTVFITRLDMDKKDGTTEGRNGERIVL